MSEDLKKVGLIFKSDSSVDFVKSLKLVNATLKENYEDFKLVQAQWDKATTGTQKLKDKLEYLNNAYDIQKDKVTALKIKLKELEEAENKNELAIQSTKASLSQAEASLQRYGNQITDTSNQIKIGSAKIEEFSKTLENAGNKIESVGNKLSGLSAASAAGLLASVKASIDFEDAFTGVRKTVDATEEQFAEMEDQIRSLSKEIPASTTEISAVAEAAGQLGIKTEDIMSFTKVMIDMGKSTNLSSELAATTLARFANITKMSQKDFDKLGSTIVDLGNNFATTEAEIADMAMRLAGAGTQVGMTQSDILALATALSSVGIESEAGGTAFSKVMSEMQVASETGGESLNNFAKVAGMSADEFAVAYKTNATNALMAFIEGLSKSDERGQSAIKVLDDMGIKEVRLRDSLLRSANASDIFSNALKVGSKAWEENTALTNEANKRYDTLKSKLQVALQKIIDMGITLGNKLMPSVEKIIKVLGEWTEKFDNLNEKQIDTIIQIGLVVASLSTAITIIGKTTSALGTVVSTFGIFSEALQVTMGNITSTKTSVNILASVFSAMTTPVGLAVTAVVAAGGAMALASNIASKEVKKDFENMGDGATDFINGIEKATSHLSSFNSTLFASAEEQQKLQIDMKSVQDGITGICKTASDERRGYTEQEIVQLNEYFSKLRDLKNKELEIQKSIANAISQQAIQNSQSFQGSLEEYQVQSQEWIKTAQEQATSEIAIINDRATQEIALLQQKYGDKATLTNEEYAKEYNAIIANKDKNINEANDEVAKVSQAYSDGYAKRSEQSNGFYSTLQQANKEIEEENTRHTNNLNDIGNNWYATEEMRRGAVQGATDSHNLKMKKIYEKMYKDLDETETKQAGAWLGMVSDTEIYGGKIDDKTKKLVDNILDSYDKMPADTKKSMQDAMSPMLSTMKEKEPALYAQATSMANGILGRLKRAFDIHSPSRKMQKIFRNVMQPAEDEMKKGKEQLLKETDEISSNTLNGFEDMHKNMSFNNKKTRYSFNNNKNNFMDLTQIIDYNKMFLMFLKALNSCKIKLDEDGFVKFIDNRIMEVI